MQKNINGAVLRKMMVTAVKYLEVNRQMVDSLNVFPVPDGDTGTNMSLTLQSSLKELNAQSGGNLDVVAEAISKGALKGARGNSGVILSQILRGFCTVLKDAQKVDVKVLARALKSGVEVAYKAVSKPRRALC